VVGYGWATVAVGSQLGSQLGNPSNHANPPECIRPAEPHTTAGEPGGRAEIAVAAQPDGIRADDPVCGIGPGVLGWRRLAAAGDVDVGAGCTRVPDNPPRDRLTAGDVRSATLGLARVPGRTGAFGLRLAGPDMDGPGFSGWPGLP
jgi:hypothetical protein